MTHIYYLQNGSVSNYNLTLREYLSNLKEYSGMMNVLNSQYYTYMLFILVINVPLFLLMTRPWKNQFKAIRILSYSICCTIIFTTLNLFLVPQWGVALSVGHLFILYFSYFLVSLIFSLIYYMTQLIIGNLFDT